MFAINDNFQFFFANSCSKSGHKSEDEVWVCNYCKSTTKKMDKYALSELSWHEYLCVRKPLQMGESQQVVSRGFTPISMHIGKQSSIIIQICVRNLLGKRPFLSVFPKKCIILPFPKTIIKLNWIL